jgi:hypothetical protein
MYIYYLGSEMQEKIGFKEFLQLFIYWKRRQIHSLQKDREKFEQHPRSAIGD